MIRYAGPVLRDGKPTYQDYSFYDLFYSEQQILAGEKPEVDPAVFRDKIVVIGTTAAGLHDLFTVPFAEGSMPGMQVHANVIDNLLSERFMRPVGAATDTLVLAGCALAVGLAGAALAVWPAMGVAALVVLALGWSSVLLFGRGLWMAVASPVLAVALAAFGGTAYQYFVEGREKRQVKRTVLPIRLERRLRTTGRGPGDARELGGAPARHVGALLRHPRIHDLHRAGQARGGRRAAERVLLAHGRGRVRAPGHGGQVRRRHGDGALRCAAGRTPTTPITRCRRRWHAGGAAGTERASGRPRGGRPWTSASASTAATWWRATSARTRS